LPFETELGAEVERSASCPNKTSLVHLLISCNLQFKGKQWNPIVEEIQHTGFHKAFLRDRIISIFYYETDLICQKG
jgi:hypothetical protein